MTKSSFIEEIAINAKKIQNKHRILPSLIIAQACLESNYGKSGLAVKGKNLFGIKGSYKGAFVEMATREWSRQSGWYTTKVRFRKYPSWEESLEDHALLFANGLSSEKINRYAALIGETNYKKATEAVKGAGYATDPDYPRLLNAIIEQHRLTKYDQPSAARKSRFYTVKAGDTLSRIAGEQGLTAAAIAKENQLTNPDLIVPGQQLLLSSKEVYYTVKSGDTLSGIASRHQRDITEIIRLNKLPDPDKIYPGQKLRIT